MIHVQNLGFSYKSHTKIFEGTSFTLKAGSIIGLLGKNGEGKTTLMRLLSGQLLRQKGSISVLGMDPAKREVRFLQRVFTVPEEVVTPKSSIRSYFDMLSPFYPNYDEKIAKELLDIFQLTPKMKLHQLSQGQRKKAVLTLAFALQVPLLLMDEPTNGLDIPSKSAFRRIMAEYTSPEQCVIISTHQVRDLDQIIDHLMILDHNKLVVNASIAEMSERFAFGLTNTMGDRQPLYTERSPIGEIGVYPALPNEDSNFSIEMLFNAVISNPQTIQEVIKK